MKKLLVVFVTFILMPLISYILTKAFNVLFIDYAFMIALLMTTGLWFFTSKGGLTGNFSNFTAQSQTTNFKMEKEKLQFTPSIAFFAAVAYTVLTLVLTIVYYKSYFF